MFGDVPFNAPVVVGCGEACGRGRNWGCVGDYRWPERERDAELPVLIHYDVSALPNWPVHTAACELSDGSCDAPLDEGQSDGWGFVDLDVSDAAGGFEGYFELSVSDYRALWYPGVPVVGPTRLNRLLVGASKKFQQDLAGQGVVPDPVLGWLAVWAFDCLNVDASDVAFERVDGPGEFLYFTDAGPVSASALGIGGVLPAGLLFNVEPGRVTVRVHPVDGDEVLGQVDLAWVRGGWSSELRIAPRTVGR